MLGQRAMVKLAEPFEIFDIPAESRVEFTVLRYQEGDPVEMMALDGRKFTIAPLRLHLKEPLSPGHMSYIDITSKRLHVSLLPHLRVIPTGGKRIAITKHGVAPKAVFELAVLPTPSPTRAR